MTSCATLFANLLRVRAAKGTAWGALAITGVRDWRLGPGHPNSLAYENKNKWQAPYPDDEIEPASGFLDIADLIEKPHRLAWILIRQIYEDFGYEESAIPFYDKKEGLFRFE